METIPSVAIIVPIYNGEKYLRETLESAAAQVYPDLQLIVVDDCSTDASPQVLLEFARCHPNVIMQKNEVNRGFCASVNWGVAACRAQLFLTLGQDDLLPPDHVAKMVEQARGDFAFSFIHCNAIVIDAGGNPIGIMGDDDVKAKETRDMVYHLATGCWISSTGLIVNKEKFLEVGGFDESYRNFGEHLLWIRMAERAKPIYCSTSKARYRRHESNMTLSIFGRGSKKNRELSRYFRQCRKEALRSKCLSEGQKMKVRLFPLWSLLITPVWFARRLARSILRGL